jgi:hypothetical protein
MNERTRGRCPQVFEIIDLCYDAETNAFALGELMLQKILSKLFIGRGVHFFDGEPDEEFLTVLDGARNISTEEQMKALDEFRQELNLEEKFTGDYGRYNEIVIQSEDYSDNLRVPFLMFTLSGDEDAKDISYFFRLDLFDVFYVGDGRFVISLYVRNTLGNHMEIYLRFARNEASRVVRAILSIFEDYMGYSNGQQSGCGSKEGDLEEIAARMINRIETAQLETVKSVSEAEISQFKRFDVSRSRTGS